MQTSFCNKQIAKIMKRIIVGILTLLAVTAGCRAVLKNLNAVPGDYYAAVKTDKPLESKYTAMGQYPVCSFATAVQGKAFRQCKIWYPAELETSDKQYPAVIFANGTGIPCSKYEPVFEHLASWGFIAVGSDEESSWSGLGASQSLELLVSLGSDKNSVFYNKVNTEQIGISGHSQGGVAVINAVNTQKGGRMFRSAFGASTTKHELSELLKWPYDISRFSIPYFAAAGTEGSDAGDGKDRNTGIAPLWSMIENSARMPAYTPSVRARRKDAFHEQMLCKGDGYMTAWFLYTLTGDIEAKNVFAGKNPELKQNQNWQDVEIKNIQ